MPAPWTKAALCRSPLVRDECRCRAAPRTRDVYPRRQLGEPRHRTDLHHSACLTLNLSRERVACLCCAHRRASICRAFRDPSPFRPDDSIIVWPWESQATPAFKSEIGPCLTITPVPLDPKSASCQIRLFVHLCALPTLPIAAPLGEGTFECARHPRYSACCARAVQKGTDSVLTGRWRQASGVSDFAHRGLWSPVTFAPCELHPTAEL